MARRFTTWGGVRINTNKTPERIVEQLNKSYATSADKGASVDSYMRVLGHEANIRRSKGAQRHGIEFDRENGKWVLNRKGQMNSQTPIAAMGGTNG